MNDLLSRHEADILQQWMRAQLASGKGSQMLDEPQLRGQSREFLVLLRDALRSDGGGNVDTRNWDEVRRMLADLSRSRATQGYSPSQTAGFVFSLKDALFPQINEEFAK